MSKVVFDRYTSTSMDRINEVEKILNVKFPQDYKILVKQYNNGRFRQYNNIPFHDDRIEVDRFISYDNEENMLYFNNKAFSYHIDGIIYFAETSAGDFIGFDYRKNRVSPSIVIVLTDYAEYSNKEPVFLAQNFEEYLDILLPEYNYDNS